MIIIQLAIAAAVAADCPIEVEGRRRPPLPAVVVVGSAGCGPCRRLEAAWHAAGSKGDAGYAWRRWIARNYRVDFVDWQTLSENDRESVPTVPAVFFTSWNRRGRVRAGPVPLDIPHKHNAVAVFGSFLLRRFPPHDKR